jgi:hypothetical protein
MHNAASILLEMWFRRTSRLRQLRKVVVAVSGAIATYPASSQKVVTSAAPAASTSIPKFEDVTEKLGIHFQPQASPTSKKYLLETMGSGVALFDYDNDGRLDIFLSNGARLDDPTPKDTIPLFAIASTEGHASMSSAANMDLGS